MKVSNSNSLLVGVVYRSPNSPEANNERLLSILRIASTANIGQVIICGDFNLPRIDWNSRRSLDAEDSFTSTFIGEVEDMSWYQHVKTATRFRNDQNSCLDLVFTSEESMVNEVNELPPMGKSDHVCQLWEVVVEELIFKNTAAMRHNFKRADWDSIKSGLRSFQFEEPDSPTAMNSKLTECINGLK